jgi:hypothetical protein
MQCQFLRCFGPEVEVLPEPPKPPQPEHLYQGPAQTPRGMPLCFRCGRPLYRNNKSHVCTTCQRKFGLPTLRRRNKPLQQWHLSICHDKNCKDPAHWADCVPVRPRRPKRPSRAKVPPGSSVAPIPHSVLLDWVTSKWLEGRARSRSAELGCRIGKSDLIRLAIKEFIHNHPDSEFFEDAIPGRDASHSE